MRLQMMMVMIYGRCSCRTSSRETIRGRKLVLYGLILRAGNKLATMARGLFFKISQSSIP